MTLVAEHIDAQKHGLRTPREAFFQKFENFGLGLKFFEAFGVFRAKLLPLFWHCESLVHGEM